MSDLSWNVRLALVVGLTICIAPPAFAAPAVTFAPATGHPQGATKVSGSGFGANEAVDIFYDTTDAVLDVTDGTGKFGLDKIAVPASALPGDHWITAIGRRDGDAAHKKFVVSTGWAAYGFNARGRRRNPYENVLNTANANRLDLAWSATTGGEIFSSPAVSQVGAAYNPFIFVGSRDQKLHAFDSVGRPKWSRATGDIVDSSPAVDGGVVYVGSEVGKVFAFHAADGSAAWSSPVKVDGSVNSSPAVANGVVYVSTGNGFIYALKTVDGSAVWPSPATTPGALPESPAVADGIVYVSASDGKVYAFKTTDGTAAWASPANVGSPIFSSPAVANGTVYIGTRDNKVYALNATTGSPVWAAPATAGGFVDSSPAVANGIVYVGSNDGKLYALNANTGAIIWTGATGGAIGSSSPAVANGVVYVASQDRLYAFPANCASTCVPLWSAVVGFITQGSPAVSDGMVFVGTLVEGHLYAFALDAGNAAAYRQKNVPPPVYATLHPDFRLKPAQHAIAAR